MKDKKMKLIKSVSLLYELSLSVGKSVYLKPNCTGFIDLLVQRMGFTFASVWIRADVLDKYQKQNHFQLIYTYPDSNARDKQLPSDHIIAALIAKEECISVGSGAPYFSALIQEEGIREGVYGLYRLGSFGFLKVYSSEENQAFNYNELAQLRAVVKKFAISLQASIAFEQLEKEKSAKQATEVALQKSDNKYKDLFENIYDAIIIQNEEGFIINMNEAAKKMIGVKNLDKPLNVMSFIHSDDIDLAMKYYKKRLTDGFYSNLVLRVVNLKGEKKFVQVNSTAIFEGGIYKGARDIFRDITEQKLAEDQLEESEQKFRKVIDTALECIILIDKDGYILDWNKCSVDTFGYEKEEVLGQQVGQLIVPYQFREAYNSEMRRFSDTGISAFVNNRIEISAIHKNDTEFPIELSVCPIILKNGKLFFSIFIRDVRERKKAENDLIQAKQTAEQARIAEQKFLANMSHEIRTPMNAVIGMTHLLYESTPNDTQKEYLDALKFSGDSLLGIINNILDLSKIEAGELEFEEESFNLVELFKGLQTSFQFKVKEKPISVVMDVDYKIENMLIGDRTRLNQILTNLLGNASKFTDQGTIGMAASLQEEKDGNYWIEFIVHDTGIGINKDKVNLIFDSFKQADATVTRKFGGTGLGLSIVKQLVELQSGEISVESEEGKGSAFKFNLPFKNSEEKAVESKSFISISDAEVDTALAKNFILIVEDNFMNQKLITKILDIWNCRYDIANNGLEGVNCTKKKKYDIVLMDVHMPEMDGCEATINIRQDEDNPNREVPIIALTAAALLDEKKRVFEAGMDDFLTKPFSPRVLKGLLRKWLNIDEKLKGEVEEPSGSEKAKIKLDFSYLYEFSGGDEFFIKEMIETFIGETPGALTQLQEALEAGNLENLYSISHRLKPTLMMMGMAEQEKIAARIEKMAKSNDFREEKLKDLTDRLYVGVKGLIPELKQKLNHL